MSTIDQESPINVHPELTVEWDGTATYEMNSTWDSDPFKKAMYEFMNSMRHDLKILTRTMIVVASELRHLRHEGHPVDTNLDNP